MENRINISELLRGCPTGMELDSTLYYNVFFDKICEDDLYPIKCYTIEDGIRNSVDFTKYGEFHTLKTSKCVIFPKGKTTWEGFVPPCKFKDGDILFVEAHYDWILIYKENENQEDLYKYVATPNYANHTYLLYDNSPLCFKKDATKIRLATEEEKAKLFKAIKDRGYKWNFKTKTLEILIEPLFKVGDIVRSKNCPAAGSFTIVGVGEDSYLINIKGYCIKFEDQDNYELVPKKFDIHTLKPLQPALVPNKAAYINQYKDFPCYYEIQKLAELIVCRNAYWKIAGDQMGLGKPWEPDWRNAEQDKFVIYTHDDVIWLNHFMLGHNVLAFPTAEMQDAFYENFKDSIELCKELL